MAWNKPLPLPTAISAPYWDGLKAHELRVQQCDQGHWLFFPRTHCPTCGSRHLEWKPVSGNVRVDTGVAKALEAATFAAVRVRMLGMIGPRHGGCR